MKNVFYVLISIAAATGISLAGGSIGWVDVKAEIAKTDKELVMIIEREFDVNPSGGGVRLGAHFGDRQGERISPFRFGALNRRTNERCELVIEESDDHWITGRFKFVVEHTENPKQAGRTGADQPAAAAEPKPEGGE